MENLGFLYALGAALAWGTFYVPFKKSNSGNVILFQALMGVGILISGFFISIFVGNNLQIESAGFYAGFLWAVANFMGLIGVANLGISRGVPIIVSLVIITSFGWGALFFGSQFVPVKLFNVSPENYFFSMSIGIFLTSWLVFAVGRGKFEKRAIIASLLSGTVWNSCTLGNNLF